MKVLHRRMGARVWCLVLLAVLACCAPAVAWGAAGKGATFVFDTIDMYNVKFTFTSAFEIKSSGGIQIDVSIDTILGASIDLTTDGQECNIVGKSNSRYVVRASNTSTTLSRDAAVGTITVGRGLDGTRVTAQEGSDLGLLRCVSPTAVANAPGAIRYAVVMAEGSGTTFDAMPGMLVVSPGALVVVDGVTYDNTGGTEDMVLPQAQAPDAGAGDTAPANTSVVHTRPVILGPSVIYLTVGYEAYTVIYRVLGVYGFAILPGGIPGIAGTPFVGGYTEITIPAGLPPGEYEFSLITAANNDLSNTDRLDVTVVVSDIERINGQTAYAETITLPWGYAGPIQRANHVTGAPIASLTLDAGGTGATLDAAGTLTIPTGLGAGTYTVRLATHSATAAYTIVVTPGTPLIDGQQAVTEDITVDIGYSAPITRAYTVGGGAGVDTITNTAGAEVTLTGGRLSVSIPIGLAEGSYQLVAEATNESTDKASLTINLTVRAEAPAIKGEANGAETITLLSGYAAYTQALQVTGFEKPALSITQNGSGVSVSGDGVLTIPTGLGVGTYTEIVTATNSQGTATRTFTILVTPVAPLLGGETAITDTIEVDVGYEQSISRSYTVTGHPIPTLTLDDDNGTGATFDQNGNITIPTGLSGGEYTLVLTARNAATETATVTLTLRVRAEAPAINGKVNGTDSISLTEGSTSRQQTYTVTGVPTPIVQLTSTEIEGAQVSAAGTLSIPEGVQPGSYDIIFTATNVVSTATMTVTVTVGQNPVALTTTSIQEWTVGVEGYTAQLSATGGSGSYTYSGTGLPDGLSLSAGGVISGTPSEAGAFDVSVTVKDANRPGNSATETVSLTINPLPTVVGDAPPAGTVGEPYSYRVPCSGGTGALVVTAESGLPAGWTLSDNTISGTPTDTVSFIIYVTITDSLGATGTGEVTISFNPAPPAPLTMMLMLPEENGLSALPPPGEDETDTGEPVEDGQLPGDGGDGGGVNSPSVQSGSGESGPPTQVVGETEGLPSGNADASLNGEPGDDGGLEIFR